MCMFLVIWNSRGWNDNHYSYLKYTKQVAKTIFFRLKIEVPNLLSEHRKLQVIWPLISYAVSFVLLPPPPSPSILMLQLYPHNVLEHHLLHEGFPECTLPGGTDSLPLRVLCAYIEVYQGTSIGLLCLLVSSTRPEALHGFPSLNLPSLFLDQPM